MRVALVTGGNRGIGAAIARRLADDGLRVAIAYGSDHDGAEAVVTGIERHGGVCRSVPCDLAGDEAGIAAMIDETADEYGRLDVLVNNAAVVEGMALHDMDSAHIDRLFAVNVRGLLLASKHAARRMEARGAIVNIGSMNGRSPVPGGAVYSATKAAVDAVTKALARELGPRGIRVNAVAPGLIMTARQEARVPEDAWESVISETPLGRQGLPEDVARVVSFLASEDAEWITGESVGVSGGAGL